MSILMDALKQQIEPNTGVPAAPSGSGWRNLALLLGFMLALLLGFVLASWWQSAAVPKASSLPTASAQPEPELADSSTIVAALVSVEPEPVAEITLQQPVQEQLQPEPKVVSVTAPAVEQAPRQVTPQSAAAAQPEVEVSDELRQRFASAMAASEIDRRQPQPAPRAMGAPAKDVSELAPALQRQIPSLRFEAHVYATQSSQRWIKVNGKSLQEGQWVTADIRLKEITPQFVLLEMGTELFSIPALMDWPQK